MFIRLTVVAALSLLIALPVFSADRLLKYLPSDAMMEFTIDPAALLKKADVNDLASLDFVKESLSDMTNEKERAMVENYLRNPSSTGFDPASRFHVFVTALDLSGATSKIKSSAKSEDVLVGFIFGLSDAARFEQFLQTASSNNAPIRKNGGISSMFLTNVIVAWNADAAIALSLSNDESMTDAETRASKILSGSGKNGLLDNSSFSNLQNRSWDLSLWIGVGKLLEGEKELLEESAGAFADEIMAGIKSMDMSVSLDFRPGELQLDVSARMTNTLDDWKSWLKPFDRKFLSNFGGKDVTAAFSFSYNMKNYMKYLSKYLGKIPGIEKDLKEAEEQMGVKLADLLGSLSVDGMFTLSGLDIMQQKFSMLGGFTLNDRKPVQKLLDNLVKAKLLATKKSGQNTYYSFVAEKKNADVPVFLFLRDNAIWVASEDERDRVLAGKKPAPLSDRLVALTTNHMAQFYVSADILKNLPIDEKDEEGAVVKEIRDNVRDIVITADSIGNNESIMRLTVSTTHPEENSLKLLTRWAGQIAAEEAAKKAARKKYMDQLDKEQDKDQKKYEESDSSSSSSALPENWWKRADSAHFRQ